MQNLEAGKLYQFIRGVRVKPCPDINDILPTTWGKHEFMMVGVIFLYLGKSITKVEYIGQGMDEEIQYFLILVNEKLYWFYMATDGADVDYFVKKYAATE
ncbi:MAG: hypothetical protein WC761_02250 [Candidatus Paceibacterota bacterium]|jgi:hypothetical protein